jgi:hypothetical protein
MPPLPPDSSPPPPAPRSPLPAPGSPSAISEFARSVLAKPLYPYQSVIAEAILASILEGRGEIFSVMLARQSGKNQLSAVLEAYLLATMPAGSIVKAAPTFTPQIVNSRLRLLSLLESPALSERVWSSRGYIIGLAPRADPALLKRQVGPRILFYSAAPTSNVVGATASLLLEIDEAQDVQPEKFDRDFRPMASTTAATTVLYGTAWSDDTLLARQRAINLEREERTGQRTHFEHDWRTLAAINPAYRRFVEQEIARLGEDHPAIQTQYFLQSLSGAGYLLSPLQRTLLQGRHAWQDEPEEEDCYVAGMDVGGEERTPPAAGLTSAPPPWQARARRDSTVVTIARLEYNELGLPALQIVHQQWWTGRPYLEQYAATLALAQRWSLRSLVIDATGLGAGLASLLRARLGEERVTAFNFTRPSKSRLTYQLLSLLNSGRLKLYAPATAPSAIYEECWRQLRLARYRLLGADLMDMYVDPADGHDDFLLSLALLGDTLTTSSQPAASTLIRPRRFYQEEGSF